MNEYIFLLYIIFVSITSLYALKWGKEVLLGLISVEVVLMNLLVPQEITLFGLSATPVDALAVGTALGLNLLNEYYGKEQAEKAIVASSFGALFYMLVTLLHLAYKPVPADIYYAHFSVILSVTPRIIIASFIAYIISQKIEAWLYAYLKNSRLSRYFIVRNYASMVITQAMDTVLFSFLGLYGIIENIWQVILVAYSIKLITIFFAVPVLALARRYAN